MVSNMSPPHHLGGYERSVPPDTVVAGNLARLSGTTAAFRRFYASRGPQG